MSRLPSFSLLAAALGLAACAAPEAITTMRHVDYVVAEPSAVAGSTTIVPTTGLPGSGRIDSVVAVPREGGSMWRVTLRMDDGSTRVVDTLTDGVMVGKRAKLDADGRLSLVEREPVVAVPAAAARSAATGSSAEPAYESRWVTPKSGAGRVESLAVVPNHAGFTYADGRPILSVWRVGVRMDDGTVQVMDSPASGLSVGKRVRITNGGNIAALSD
ncbi:MAG: hypothetical protein ACT4P4_25665 [Betaproteobacteria bacterium]